MLFWLSVVIFIVLAIPILLYSFGYRFSWNELRIVRAGGLIVTSIPRTGAKIVVDGKLVHETSFLSRRAFLQGLTPRRYHIEVTRDGYTSWEKTLPVLPERVTDAEAILFPENMERGTIIQKLPITATTTEALNQEVETFLKLKKPKGRAYDESSNRLVWHDGNNVWIKWFGGERYLPLYAETDEVMIFPSSYPVRSIGFYPSLDAILIAFSSEIRVVELDGRDKRNQFPIYSGVAPSFVISNETETLYVLDNKQIIAIPLSL